MRQDGAYVDAYVINLCLPRVPAMLLSALADLTYVLPGCDAGEVRTAAANLAVALKLIEHQPAQAA